MADLYAEGFVLGKSSGRKEVANKILKDYFKPNKEPDLIGLYIYLSIIKEE